MTGWLKRSRISVGGVSTRDCVTGSELCSVTCAKAADGASSATTNRAEQDEPSPHGEPGPKRPKMGATSRSAKSSTASSTNVTAKPARQIDLTRPHRLAEREQRDDHEHPADRVVEEGGSRVQPPVRLVDEEGHAGGEQREARHERPQRAVQLPAYDRELHGAGDERRLRPDGVGEQVHRRERREDGDQPQPDGRRDDDRREQIRAPGAAPEDLRADDHLGDEHEPDEQRDRRREPVGHLSPRDHAPPRASRSSISPGAIASVKTSPTRTTRSGAWKR